MKKLNKISNFFDSLFEKVSSRCYTFIMIMKMKINGVQYNNKIKFFGITKFKKSSSAIIMIGTNCSFRSTHTSNLIGVNRPCIFSALTAEAVLKVGDNCGFSGTVIGCFNEIILEDNVRCGANTLITDSDWHLDDPRVGKSTPIKICKNVWLGEGVKVLKGVVIGENTVIGAGSIVTKSIPDNVIAAGNPCRVIKAIEKK